MAKNAAEGRGKLKVAKPAKSADAGQEPSKPATASGGILGRRGLLLAGGLGGVGIAAAGGLWAYGRRARQQVAAAPVSLLSGTSKLPLLTDAQVMSALRALSGPASLEPVLHTAETADWEALTRAGQGAGYSALWPDTNLVGPEDARPALASTLVIAAERRTAASLLAAGLASRSPYDSGILLDRLDDLVNAAETGRRWTSVVRIGPQGNVRFALPDPNRSDVGLLALSLLIASSAPSEAWSDAIAGADANLVRTLAGFTVADEFAALESLLQEPSGQGTLAVVTESSVVTWSLRAVARGVSDRIVPLYPRPTMACLHPYQATTPLGERVGSLFASPEFQALAWRRFGFRSGIGQEANGEHGVPGIPSRPPVIAAPPSRDQVAALAQTLAGLAADSQAGR